MLWHVLDAGTVVDQLALCLHVVVHCLVPLGEIPLVGDVDLLATVELELGPPGKSPDCVGDAHYESVLALNTEECSKCRLFHQTER